MSLSDIPTQKIGPEPLAMSVARRLRTTFFLAAVAAVIATFTLLLGMVSADPPLSYRIEIWCFTFWGCGGLLAIGLLTNRQWLEGALTLIVVAIIGGLVWRFAAPLLIASGILGPYIIPIES